LRLPGLLCSPFAAQGRSYRGMYNPPGTLYLMGPDSKEVNGQALNAQ